MNKELYKLFSEKETSMPLFIQYNWIAGILDEEDWGVAVEKKGEEVIAVMPYMIKKKYAMHFLHMPHLTPYLGVWISYPEGQKKSSKRAYEKQIITSLIQQLPKFSDFQMKFHPGFSNWFPFYLQGFTGNIHYTYILQGIKDLQSIFSNMRENIKRQIKKGEKLLSVAISDNVNNLYEIKTKALKIDNVHFNVSKEFLNKVYQTCKRLDCGQILEAKDPEGKVYAATLLVWDQNYCYYLFGGTDPDFRDSGAMSYLLWEAIKYSSTKVDSFNFEGSMIPSVEHYFQGFGGDQTPYFKITKTNSYLLKTATFIKELKNN